MPIQETANSLWSVNLTQSSSTGHKCGMRQGHMQGPELSTQRPFIRSAYLVGLLRQGLRRHTITAVLEIILTT